MISLSSFKSKIKHLNFNFKFASLNINSLSKICSVNIKPSIYIAIVLINPFYVTINFPIYR